MVSARLLRSHAFRTRTYGSGQQFLAALPAGLPDCLIVDLQMPEINGLELQQHLVSNGIKIPTILITAYDDVGLRDHRGLVAIQDLLGHERGRQRLNKETNARIALPEFDNGIDDKVGRRAFDDGESHDAALQALQVFNLGLRTLGVP